MSRRRMKLPNGYGSVFKLSGRRRRPWAARVTTGWTDEGKQIYYYVGYYETQTAALDALAEYRKNPLGATGDITLGGLLKRWTNTTAYRKLAEKTKETYDTAWKHLAVLEDVPVKEIRKSHLQDVVDGMVGHGLSYSSCHKVKVLAGLLLKEALADNIVKQNYASLVTLPEKGESKQQIFNDLEIQKIAQLAATDPWANTILIMIYTGMRISELVGLTKFNVDLDRMLITGGVKTDAGKDRIVPIHSKIQPYIIEWHQKPGPHLITRNGQPIRDRYYRNFLFYPTLERAGVRRLTPHVARHTFATLLSRANANTKAIQMLMGHADYSTTANIYTHLELNELREAVEQL